MEGLEKFIRKLNNRAGRASQQTNPQIPITVHLIHPYIDPIIWGKELIWMEGPSGWTSWVDIIGSEDTNTGMR
ncbi:hypothetical protein SUGI_0881070 [Cryptomeria japonica]|nr:hypothetical protein SUGI_0881070 [Cryptomeria japonica]